MAIKFNYPDSVKPAPVADPLIKKNFYLHRDLAALLDGHCARTGVPRSETIRRALIAYLSNESE